MKTRELPVEFILQRLTYLQCPYVPNEYSTNCFDGQCSKFSKLFQIIIHSYKASERGGQLVILAKNWA